MEPDDCIMEVTKIELDGRESCRIVGVIDDADWLCDNVDTEDDALKGVKETVLGGAFIRFVSAIRRTLCCRLRFSIWSDENPAYFIATFTANVTAAAAIIVPAACTFGSVSSDMFSIDPHIGGAALLLLRSSTRPVTTAVRNLCSKMGGNLSARFSCKRRITTNLGPN
jgi:hypothetical protein